MIKLIDDENSLYESAVFRPKTTGQPFDIWVDEFGKDRNTKHHEPRFKVTSNGVELDLILHRDNSVEIVNDAQTIRKFKNGKKAVDFIKKYEKPLRAHWNHDIDTFELGAIFKMTKSDAMTILDAMVKIASGEDFDISSLFDK